MNGQDQGQLRGVRAPYSNYPIENVNHPDFACNTNLQLKDSNVITVPAGARVGGGGVTRLAAPRDPTIQTIPSQRATKVCVLRLKTSR